MNLAGSEYRRAEDLAVNVCEICLLLCTFRPRVTELRLRVGTIITTLLLIRLVRKPGTFFSMPLNDYSAAEMQASDFLNGNVL